MNEPDIHWCPVWAPNSAHIPSALHLLRKPSKDQTTNRNSQPTSPASIILSWTHWKHVIAVKATFTKDSLLCLLRHGDSSDLYPSNSCSFLDGALVLATLAWLFQSSNAWAKPLKLQSWLSQLLCCSALLLCFHVLVSIWGHETWLQKALACKLDAVQSDWWDSWEKILVSTGCSEGKDRGHAYAALRTTAHRRHAMKSCCTREASFQLLWNSHRPRRRNHSNKQEAS